jgi:hypothetical protein
LIQQFGQTRLYENRLSRPRAWIQPQDTEGIEDIQAVTILKYEPNEIRVTAKGPGVLILSEIEYPGWQMTVDNDLMPIESGRNLLRSVSLDDGEHDIRFFFRPKTLNYGLLGLIIGIVLWAIIGIRKQE